MYTGAMLSVERTPTGGYGLQTQHVSPMVYLDHWAFRLFSSDTVLSSDSRGRCTIEAERW